jgi:hypothetical protein
MGFAFLAITMNDPGAFDLKQGIARVQYVGERHASGF